ncbi:hypothetical protein KEM55_008944 [Ascosphaera atra]|nr:hypothetical protein KEM55_008944 [Ascosphaera atra]
MSGGDANIQQLEEEYRFRTFQGTSICITGWNELDFRLALEEQLKANGANFQKDLTKEATHLIAKAPTGKKFEFATAWGVRVVSLKWVKDSVARGMILDESLYHPSVPEEKQGIGAWNRPSPTMAAPTKRPNPAPVQQRARKLRRAASMKLGSQTGDMWGAILADSEAATPEPASDASAWKEDQGDVTLERTSPNAQEEMKPIMIEDDDNEETKVPAAEGEKPKVRESVPVPEQHEFWYGCRFFIYGFTKSQTRVLETHMRACDAELVKSIQDLCSTASSDPQPTHRFILVPYESTQRQLPLLDDYEIKPQFVNNLWIEKCLHRKRFFPPEEHAACTPFPEFPIPEFRGLTISSSGFVSVAGIDVNHLSKVVNLMGAKYNEFLSPEVSVLVCVKETANQEKLRHVSNWGVPAVSEDWIWDCVKHGVREPLEPYLLQEWKPKERSRTNSHDSHSRAQSKVDDGKEARKPEPTRLGPFVMSQDDAPPFNQEDMRTEDWRPAAGQSTSEATRHERQQSKSTRSHEQPPQPRPATRTTRTTRARDGKSAAPASNQAQDANETNSRLAIDNAINNLLKKGTSASKAPSIDGSDPGNTKPKRRRKLFGRANSSGSTTLTGPASFKREYSVDTTNGDGHRSAGANSPMRSLGEQGNEDRKLLEARLGLLDSGQMNPYMNNSDEEDEVARTQLRYEDPDAAALKAAMRATADAKEDGQAGQEEREGIADRLRENERSQTLPHRRVTRSSTKYFN